MAISIVSLTSTAAIAFNASGRSAAASPVSAPDSSSSQAHAMLSSTEIRPPQLTSSSLQESAAARNEFAELGGQRIRCGPAELRSLRPETRERPDYSSLALLAMTAIVLQDTALFETCPAAIFRRQSRHRQSRPSAHRQAAPFLAPPALCRQRAVIPCRSRTSEPPRWRIS